MGLRNHLTIASIVVPTLGYTSACAREPRDGWPSEDQDGSVASDAGQGSSAGGSGSESGAGSGSSSGGSIGSSSGGSIGSSSGSSTGSGSGGQGSTSGSTSGGSSGSSSGQSSGGEAGPGDAGCSAAVSAGAIPLTGGYLAASVIGDGGYAYSFQDDMGSTACVDTTAYCAAGSTGIADLAGTVWGAGVGSSLNQALATGPTSPPVHTYAATGSGVTYTLDGLPSQGMRLIIDQAGTDYCAHLTAAADTIKWSSFNTKCWDGSGTTLAGAPQQATHLQFQVPAGTIAAPFAFCVESLSFAP